MSKIIKNWEDLDGLWSKTHHIVVNHYNECGWIVPDDEDKNSYYLSTHTFAKKLYKGYEELLRSCGFDIEIVPWD